ncbi:MULTISPECIES: hypothetical protein [unclassified Coleofasciculus]|uniref:hypothetical protein n=1 Tax=unclassified Coleofasciculus TaxID=2692782 RepID=UPI0018802443|nr:MULTISPECIES: hypothetical protein [unclassified Coleofasciculus]MBE9128014.1 hypothetical protein [Coleofasciculus sp. LEGE 07081]MBE9150546.1 hypothetical protein [Coleofasciculus sp. LEGE 07092]
MHSQVNQSHVQVMEQVIDQVTAWMSGTIEDIKVRRNNETVYDSKSADPEKRKVSAELIQDVAKLKQTPPGEEIEASTDSMEVEVNESVTMRSHGGIVTTNIYQEPEFEPDVEPDYMPEWDDYIDDPGAAWESAIPIETEELKFSTTGQTEVTSSSPEPITWEEITAASPGVEPDPEPIILDADSVTQATPTPITWNDQIPQEEKIGGLQITQNAVDTLSEVEGENSPLKQLLNDTLTQMRQLREQTQQIAFSQQQLLEGRKANNSPFDKAQGEPSWWQKAVETSQTLQNKLTQKDTAATIQKLFHSQVPPPGKEYQAADYTITREGKSYTLSDKQGNTLLSFEKKAMGIKVNESNLTIDHTEQIAHAKQQMKSGISPDGAFQSSATRDARIFERTNALAHALTRYAQAEGKPVKVDGNLSYRWEASPDGNIKIESKDGRGTLMVKSGGEVVCNMSEKDILHFEQAFSSIGRAQNNMSISR